MHSKQDVFFVLRKFAPSSCNKDWVKKNSVLGEWQSWWRINFKIKKERKILFKVLFVFFSIKNLFFMSFYLLKGVSLTADFSLANTLDVLETFPWFMFCPRFTILKFNLHSICFANIRWTLTLSYFFCGYTLTEYYALRN